MSDFFHVSLGKTHAAWCGIVSDFDPTPEAGAGYHHCFSVGILQQNYLRRELRFLLKATNAQLDQFVIRRHVSAGLLEVWLRREQWDGEAGYYAGVVHAFRHLNGTWKGRARRAAASPRPTVARFWDFHAGSLVRITLTPGRDRALTTQGGPTEEGYSYTTTSWTLHADVRGHAYVLKTTATEARDCDGRISREGQWKCYLPDLARGERAHLWGRLVNDDGYCRRELRRGAGPALPRWEDRGSTQRDYAAEAAGY